MSVPSYAESRRVPKTLVDPSVDPTADRDWRRDLRARGYRLTPQREQVLEAIRELDHATPDAIVSHVHSKPDAAGLALNLSTVYRTLELLQRIGLVSHAHLGHGSPAYHAADAPLHIHAVCRSCGSISDVSADLAADLVGRMEDTEGFVVDVRHLSVTGLCATCAEQVGSGIADAEADVDS